MNEIELIENVYNIDVLDNTVNVELQTVKTNIIEIGYCIADGGGGGTSDHNLLTNRDMINQHPISAITDLQSSLDGKEPANSNIQSHIADTNIHITSQERTDWNGKAEISDIPTNLSELNNDTNFINTNDARLSDARNPLPHVHAISDVTDLSTDLLNITNNISDIQGDITDINDELDTKEPLLPATPINPDSKYLNGNRQWSEIIIGSGGYAANIYLSNSNSTIVSGYKIISYTPDYVSTEKSIICNNGETAGDVYLYEQPIGITTIDAGSWIANLYSKVSSVVGNTYIRLELFARTSAGVENTLLSFTSDSLENTSYSYNRMQTIKGIFTVNATDRLGLRVFAGTSHSTSITVTYNIGDGNASYFTTPLSLRHTQLRGLNDDANNQHITLTQVNGLHTHSNKSTLDNLTQTVIDNSHTHSNKSVLDDTTASFTTTLKTAYDKSVINNYTQTSLTIDGNNGNFFFIEISANASFSLSNITTYRQYYFMIKNTGASSITVTLPNTADIKSALTVTIGASKTKELAMIYNGTNRYWQISEELT